ncbi:hypothetical protein P4O66_017902 [Electrophorus voltai]|uniref:Ig-like domain-containing protein n=1 Tax=Electrophorus voltai TaxID=2609070 RepID=A0AAD8YUE1_9TELE|nr:hypothetical protein P4O66_017902 [Electrophorus voltai]
MGWNEEMVDGEMEQMVVDGELEEMVDRGDGGRWVYVLSLEVTVSQSSVQVARGQAAILPCTFTTSAALNNLYIIWMVTPLANANQPEQIHRRFTCERCERVCRCCGEHYAACSIIQYDQFGGGSVICRGICAKSHTNFEVIANGTLTSDWYRDKILRASVKPYADAVSPRFLLMQDNAQPYVAKVCRHFPNDKGVDNIDRLSFSLNPIENLWGIMYQCIECHQVAPQTVQEVNDALIQVIIYQGGQVFSLANHMAGRVGFVATMPSTSASIFINHTQLSDTGTYQCLVNNLPDRGGRNIGVIGLTVLVCRIQGSLDVGSDVMLLCGSDEGIPTPTYSWEKLNSVPRLPHTATQDQTQGTTLLRNISVGTSGLYQCTAANVIGRSTCLLNLQVVAPQPQSVGLIAGTVATAVLAVVICSLLVVVSLFYWRNKNKYDEDEIPNEIREDDLPPKRSSSVKAFHADASSSENDTLTSTNTYNSRYWHNPKANYDTNSYTRYNGDTLQTFTVGGGNSSGGGTATGTAPIHTAYTNGSHTLPPPKTLVVTTNSAPSPPAITRSNGSLSLRPPVSTTPGPAHGPHVHTHSYAVSQAALERMGAVPVMVPAQSRAGSLV